MFCVFLKTMPIKRSVLFVLLALAYLLEPICQASTSKERGTLYEITDSQSTDPALNDKYFQGVVYTNLTDAPYIPQAKNVFLISQLQKFSLATRVPSALSNCNPISYSCTGQLYKWVALTSAPFEFAPGTTRWCDISSNRYITQADGTTANNPNFAKYCRSVVSASFESFSCSTADDCVSKALNYAPTSCSASQQKIGNACCTPSATQRCDVCNAGFGTTSCSKQLTCSLYNNSYRKCTGDIMGCEYYKDKITNCNSNNDIPLVTGYTNFIRIPSANYTYTTPMNIPYPFATRTAISTSGGGSAFLHKIPLEAQCKKNFTTKNTSTNLNESLTLNPKLISKGGVLFGSLDSNGVAKIWSSFIESQQTSQDKYGQPTTQAYLQSPQMLFDGGKVDNAIEKPSEVAKTGDSGNNLLKCNYQDGCFIWGSSLANTEYQDKLLFLKNNLGYPQKNIYTNITCKQGFLSTRDPDSVSIELKCDIMNSSSMKVFNKSQQAASEYCVSGCWVQNSSSENKFINTTFENKDFVGVYANQPRDVTCKDGYEIELDAQQDLPQINCTRNSLGVTSSYNPNYQECSGPGKIKLPDREIPYRRLEKLTDGTIKDCYTEVQCVKWDYLLTSEYGSLVQRNINNDVPWYLSAPYGAAFTSCVAAFPAALAWEGSVYAGANNSFLDGFYQGMLPCIGYELGPIPYYPPVYVTGFEVPPITEPIFGLTIVPGFSIGREKCEVGRYYSFGDAPSLFYTYIPESHFREVCTYKKNNSVDTEVTYYGYSNLQGCVDGASQYYCPAARNYMISKGDSNSNQYTTPPSSLKTESWTSNINENYIPEKTFTLNCQNGYVTGYKKCVPSFCYLPEGQGYKKTKYSNSRAWQDVNCTDGLYIIRQPDGTGTDYIFENGFQAKCYNGTLSYQRLDGTSITPEEASTYKCESVCKLDNIAKDKTMKTIFKGNYINDSKATPSSGTCDSNGKVNPLDSGICIADQITNTYRFLPCDSNGNPKVANSGICLKNSRGVYDFAPSVVVDKNLFLREGQSLNVKCTDANNNEYNSYNATCNANSGFNGLIGCTQINLTCGGKTNIFYATKITESKTLTEGSFYDVNCGEGYYSGFAGSDKTTMTFKCLNNTLYFLTPSGLLSTLLPQCTRKCPLKNLLQYGDVKAKFDDKSFLILPTSKELIEPMTKPTITCNSLIGEEWGFVDSNGNSTNSVKTVCNSTGDYQVLGFSGIAKCVNLGCKNSEILFMNSFKNPVPQSYRESVTNHLKQIECPFGYRRIANGFKPAVCIAGTWKGDKAIECIIDPATPESRKPQIGASVSKYLSVKIRNNIIPNATISGGEVIQDSSGVKILKLNEGDKLNASCNTGYAFYIDQTTSINAKNFTVTNGKLGITSADRCLKLVSLDKITKNDSKVIVSISGTTTRLQAGAAIKPGTELKVECDNTGQATSDAIGIIEAASTSYTTTVLENGTLSNDFGTAGKVCVSDYKQCSVENLATLIDFTSIDQASFTEKTSGKYYIPNGSVVPLVAKTGFSGPIIPKCVSGFWDRGPKTTGATTTAPLNPKPYRAFASCSSEPYEGYYADSGKKFNKDIMPYAKAKRTFKDGESIFLKCKYDEYDFANDSMDCPEGTGLSGKCGASTCVNGKWSNDIKCMTWITINVGDDATYFEDTDKYLYNYINLPLQEDNLFIAYQSKDKYGNDLNGPPKITGSYNYSPSDLNNAKYSVNKPLLGIITADRYTKVPFFGTYSAIYDSKYYAGGTNWDDGYDGYTSGNPVLPWAEIDFGKSNEVIDNLISDYPSVARKIPNNTFQIKVSSDAFGNSFNLRCNNSGAYLVYRAHFANAIDGTNCDNYIRRRFRTYYMPAKLKCDEINKHCTTDVDANLLLATRAHLQGASGRDRILSGKFMGVQCVKNEANLTGGLYPSGSDAKGYGNPVYVELEENANYNTSYCSGSLFDCRLDTCGQDNFD